MPDPDDYRLLITADAKADLRRLDKSTAQRILKKMTWVAQNATILAHEALAGEWGGFFRWRIGDYRVIYTLDHETRTIVIVVIGHHREVYEG